MVAIHTTLSHAITWALDVSKSGTEMLVVRSHGFYMTPPRADATPADIVDMLNKNELFYIVKNERLLSPLSRRFVTEVVSSFPERERKARMCQAVGHSLLVHIAPDGIRSCSRCGGFLPAADQQIPVGVNNRKNREAFAKLDWRHKLLGIEVPFGPKHRTNEVW